MNQRVARAEADAVGIKLDSNRLCRHWVMFVQRFCSGEPFREFHFHERGSILLLYGQGGHGAAADGEL
ncbi:hypothetical protein SAMN05444746_13716 [Variovorax sp. OK212]|nr:hypothetical protein SAMN05518853_13916 [Variovorax sp. OK202]SFE76126.1 hypothetical protein SAMN05444746_13716 [Variovorax sp. OK212]